MAGSVVHSAPINRPETPAKDSKTGREMARTERQDERHSGDHLSLVAGFMKRSVPAVAG